MFSWEELQVIPTGVKSSGNLAYHMML